MSTHRSKLGFQNTEYSCQVPVSTCAVPYWFLFATCWFLFTQELFFVLNYYIKLKWYIKIIRGGDEVEVMAGRGVKHSRQCCKYRWGGRHACAHAIICLCLCPPRHLATFVWPSLVLACAHLGVVCAQCLSPLPGCICLTSAHSHLCSFGVICACSASICTRLCLSSLSLVPVSNIWLVHTWWTDSPLYHKLFTCIRTID
jgi:hypothetical protein